MIFSQYRENCELILDYLKIGGENIKYFFLKCIRKILHANIFVWKTYCYNVDSIGNVAPLGISYWEVFLLVLKWIYGYRLWHQFPHGQEIPYLSTYTMLSHCPTVHQNSHKVVALPIPQLGHRRSQLTSIPTKYPEQTTAPTKLPQKTSASDQISLTCVDPGSIVSSCCHSSRSSVGIGTNRSEPRPNISNTRRGSNNLHQFASTSLARRRDYAWHSLTDTMVQRIVSNRRCNSMDYCQTTPGISKLVTWPPGSRPIYWLLVVLRRARPRLSSPIRSIELF